MIRVIIICQKSFLKYGVFGHFLAKNQHFCLVALLAKLLAKQPKTLKEIVKIVEDFAQNMSYEQVRKMVENVLKRAELFLKEKGSHFEHKM